MPEGKNRPGLKSRVRNLSTRLLNRRSAANFFMLSFIIFTSIGAGLITPPLGLITAGVTSGVFGFLLGLE